MLDQISEKLGGRRSDVIGGDFNGWDIRVTNPSGRSLMEIIFRLNFVLVNKGSTSTYGREGRESTIDVTFCSPTVASSMNWRV